MSAAAKARGKAEERRIAAMFGTTRRGSTGLPGSDLDPELPWSVEVKNSSLAGIQGKWIDQAREQGKAEGKPWLLVVRRKGAREPTVTMDLKAFLALDIGPFPDGEA